MRETPTYAELEKRIQHLEHILNLARSEIHDLKNIFFPIIGMSELLLDDLSPGSSAYECAAEILAAGEKGSEMVDQMRVFTRLGDRKQQAPAGSNEDGAAR